MRAVNLVACLRIAGLLAVLGLACYDPNFVSGVTECDPDGSCPYDWVCQSGVCVDPAEPGSTGAGGASAGGHGGATTSGTGNTTGGGGAGGAAGGSTSGTGNTTGAAGSSGGAGGGSTSGTGNTTGAAGSGGAGGGSALTCGAAWAVDSNHFVKAPAYGGACWHGYAFADGDDSSNVTLNLSNCGTSCTLNMTGTVGSATAANNYAGYVILGFNIAQATGTATVGKAAPKGTSLKVAFASSSAAPTLRVALYDGATTWCATISGTSPVTIPYTAFNTACWDGTGTAYAKQAIESIMLTIPGVETPAAVNLTLASVGES